VSEGLQQVSGCVNVDAHTLIYSSSQAVYGQPLPEIVTDSVIPTPESSYGAEKVSGCVNVDAHTQIEVAFGAGRHDAMEGIDGVQRRLIFINLRFPRVFAIPNLQPLSRPTS
jgi:hypothetical protein